MWEEKLTNTADYYKQDTQKFWEEIKKVEGK